MIEQKTDLYIITNYLYISEETAIISPKSCGKENVELLVFVTTAPNKFASRRVIRKTWGNKLKKSSANVKVFFTIGKPKDMETHDQIIQESGTFEDILYEDFEDTYLNLTLKTSFMLKWSIKNCPQTKFIFKVMCIILNSNLTINQIYLS